jgi:hypothetical protein
VGRRSGVLWTAARFRRQGPPGQVTDTEQRAK